MSLSGAELRAVAGELAGLSGARVQRVFVPAARTALLDLRLPGRSALLLLETEGGLARAGVVSARPPAPARPLAFQGLLRAQLAGARVDHVEALAPERVLQIRLSTDAGERLLVAELRGREGFLVLALADGTVLGVSPPEPAPPRMLDRGAVWSPPEPVPEGGVRAELKAAAAAGGDFPVSAALESLYGGRVAEHRLAKRRGELLPMLRAARKRLARTLDKVRADRARIAEADRYRRLGDLLKPELHRLKRGPSVARVVEYGEAGPVPVEVPLLPNLSPLENMERYYHLHRRLARSAALVEGREQTMAARLARCEDLLARAEAAQEPEALEDIAAEARRAGFRAPAPQPRPGARAPAERVPWREFRSAAGRRILVGRSAEDNDALTFRQARGNDLWLHARGVPGSHVVVPTGEGEADGETQLDAATLAVHFSDARGETSFEVSVTRCKHVRKPKGAGPGAVRYSQERTVLLRLEPERLSRLLAAEGAPADAEAPSPDAGAGG